MTGPKKRAWATCTASGQLIMKFGLLLVNTIAAATTIGCASTADTSRPPETGTIIAELPFVTNRFVESRARGKDRMSNRPGELRGGSCTVEIDKEESELLNYEIAPVSRTIESLREDAETGLTLYIHGYNEGFSKNCRYAAVLRERLLLRHSLLLFSWPADNKVVTYGADVRRMRATHESLAELLGLLAGRFGADNINIVAHSLGSRGAMDTILGSDSMRGLRFRKLVLVAPDVDPQRFEAILPVLQRHVSDITVFVAGNDRALSISEILHREPRLGNDTEWQNPVVDVVDVTTLNTGHFSRHMYHVRNPQIATLVRATLMEQP